MKAMTHEAGRVHDNTSKGALERRQLTLNIVTNECAAAWRLKQPDKVDLDPLTKADYLPMRYFSAFANSSLGQTEPTQTSAELICTDDFYCDLDVQAITA